MAVGGLQLGRINVPARTVGIARRALLQATAYAQIRETFGQPIAQHQAIQLKLDAMATRARDAPLLCTGEGTNEMQRIFIARQLIERNPVLRWRPEESVL